MDPFACLCWSHMSVCTVSIVFSSPRARYRQSYVLHESRTLRKGKVHKNLVLVGPHWIGVIVTLTIIVVATAMFVKQQCTTLPWYYTLYTFGFCSVTLYYLFETACRDPGIILPHGHRDAKDAHDGVDDAAVDVETGNLSPRNDQQEEELLSQRLTSSSVVLMPPMRNVAAVGDRRRVCDICGVTQEQYTEHCDDCDVCIDEYDHHCPWMGKCIGKKNMRAFKLFNVSWVLYVVFVLAVAIQNVQWGEIALQRYEKTSTGSWMRVPRETPQHFWSSVGANVLLVDHAGGLLPVGSSRGQHKSELCALDPALCSRDGDHVHGIRTISAHCSWMPLHSHRLGVVVVVASVGCVVYLFLLSLAIGFPLPFTLVIGALLWASIILGLSVYYFGKLYRETQQFRIDLGNYTFVDLAQVSMTFVYPSYVCGFNAISPSAQKHCFLLLPVIKIVFKNSASRFLGELDDLKPEIAILNVDVFNALCVSSCMQALSSIGTSLMVFFVDGLQAFVSLCDILKLKRQVDYFISTMPSSHPWHSKHFIDVALAIVEEDSFVKNHPSLRAKVSGY
ncbi:S-acyltransferase 8 protein, partial [Globisporangium splendens]